MPTCVCAYVCVHVLECMFVSIHTGVCVHARAWVCACVYVCVQLSIDTLVMKIVGDSVCSSGDPQGNTELDDAKCMLACALTCVSTCGFDCMLWMLIRVCMRVWV